MASSNVVGRQIVSLIACRSSLTLTFCRYQLLLIFVGIFILLVGVLILSWRAKSTDDNYLGVEDDEHDEEEPSLVGEESDGESARLLGPAKDQL